jgi:DNA polymerase I-like protein with 3'-5' exonuclease and polymerase domains
MKNNNYKIVDSYNDIVEVLYHLSTVSGPLALDTETTGLDMFTCKIVGMSLCAEAGESFYIVFAKYDKVSNQLIETLSDKEKQDVVEKLKVVLLNPSRQLMLFNASYDTIVIRETLSIDILPNIWMDVQLAKHTCDERRPNNLKAVAVKYLGAGWDSAQKDLEESVKANGGSWLKESKDMYKADIQVLGYYGAADADMTYQLGEIFYSELESQGLIDFFFTDEVMPLLPITIGMIYEGVHVDVDYLKQLQTELEAETVSKLKEAHQDLKTNYSKHYNSLSSEILEESYEISPSGKMFAKMYELKGHDMIYSPSTGKPSFVKKVIEQAYAESPECNVLKYKMALISKEVFMSLERELICQARTELFAEDNPGDYIINFGSSDHLRRLFYGKLGESVTETTDGGLPSTDKTILDKFAERYTFVKLIRDISKANKLLGTYVRPLLEESINGVYHPKWFQAGTDSGRYASNFQQLPRDDKRIKHAIIPRDKYVLIGSDYSQLEPRIFSSVSSEEVLINSFKKGEDFYGTFAVKFFKLDCNPNDVKEKYPDLRQTSKNTCLALAYGAGEWKVSQMLNCSLEEAKEFVEKYWNTFPNLHKYVKLQHGKVLKYHEVQNQTGRKRRFDGVEELKRSKQKDAKWRLKSLLNIGVNFPIQSLAASIVNRAAIQITKEFKENNISGHVALQVHDEIICEVEQSRSEEARSIMKKCMENVLKLPVPLEAKPIIADRLSGCK